MSQPRMPGIETDRFEFPSLAWFAAMPEAALEGICQVAIRCRRGHESSWRDRSSGSAEKHYSGEFGVRIPPEVHRSLAMQVAEQGVSLNRPASARLAGGYGPSLTIWLHLP